MAAAALAAILRNMASRISSWLAKMAAIESG